MPRPIRFVAALLVLLAPVAARAGKIEPNVTLSSYWVSNYKYFHSEQFVTIKGMTGNQWPDTQFEGKFRADFLGPMSEQVDWNRVTKRQLMSVRGMSWGQVNFGDGRGGDNKAWAWRIDKAGKKTPITGIWYLYIDRDIRPGTYPKIQLMPQTRPANWYRGYKKSYYQIPFPQMMAAPGYKIAANNGDYLPMGAVFRITKLGTNLHSVPNMNAFLTKSTFQVLDMGVGGRGLDIHQGLQYFEAEDMNKYSLFMPGSTMRDTRGATLEILGVQSADGKFVAWNKNGRPTGPAALPK
jgi:hypothetical protein